MKKWIYCSMLIWPVFLKAQSITTFAGIGSSNYSGDNGLAILAGIPDPIGGVFDQYGNYYFADGLGVNRIRKIDTAGIITTVAGNGTGTFSGDNGLATAAGLYLPQTVILDTSGNMYIADAGNNRIRKVDANTGIITTIAGNGTGSYAGDSGVATAAELWNPEDICIDKKGNLYIADMFNHRIRKINTSGIITTFAGTGTAGFSGDLGPANEAEIGGPTGIAADDTGNIYIADDVYTRIRKIDTFGIITTVAGNGTDAYLGDGVAATSTGMEPVKVATDNAGNLFIAGEYNERIFKVDVAGIIYSIAGDGTAGDIGDGGPATAAELYSPNGIALDSCGNIYIPTAGDASVVGSGRRIRKVAFNPDCWPERINNIAPQSISIYPNPVYEVINVDGVTTQTKWSLLNINGIIEQTGILKQGNNTIGIEALPPGVYILEMIDDEGNKTIKKIVKE